MTGVADRQPMLGRWHILATTLPFWRGKAGPVVEYAALPDGRIADTLRWRQAGRERTLRGVDTPRPGGGFRWRGEGWLVVVHSDWVLVELEEPFAVTWFARATFGLTPEGMDVYGRDPSLDPWPIVTRIRADPRYAHLHGWEATEPG